MMVNTPRVIIISSCIYRLLLQVYPASFRYRFGQDMLQVFQDCCRDVYNQKGAWGVIGLWGPIFLDWVVSVINEYFKEVKMAKILVAEDDPRSLELLSKNLEEWGYTVVSTSNGEEALHKVANEKFDLIVSDWMMPHVTGIELCKTLKKRERTRNIPVIMVSAIKNPEDIDKAYDAGVEKFFTKPFNRNELQGSISQVLSGA